MFYADLSTKCQVDSGPQVRAVGWLGKRNGVLRLFGARHPFTVGEVDSSFVDRLREHIRNAWQPVGLMGWHSCEFCRDPHARGGTNIWIPTRSLKYVAPELIVHYIESHCYLPPQEFIAAVMQCPPQESDEFFQLMSGFDNWWKAQPDAAPRVRMIKTPNFLSFVTFVVKNFSAFTANNVNHGRHQIRRRHDPRRASEPVGGRYDHGHDLADREEFGRRGS